MNSARLRASRRALVPTTRTAPRHAGDQLGEAAQAVQAPLDGLFAEQARLVQTGGQLDLFAQPLKDADFPVGVARPDDVKAVRAQVDRGDQFVGFGWRRLHLEALGDKPRHRAS